MVPHQCSHVEVKLPGSSTPNPESCDGLKIKVHVGKLLTLSAYKPSGQ